MSAQTPIMGMGLQEARRSLLYQIQEERNLSANLAATDVRTMDDVEVEKTVNEFLVRHNNILLTVEHIEDLEGKIKHKGAKA